MPSVIAQPCTGAKNAACVTVCPIDCIHPTPGEPGFADAKQLYIDPDSCTDCGLCNQTCPAHAIFPEEDLPPQWQHFAAINAHWYAPGAPGSPGS